MRSPLGQYAAPVAAAVSIAAIGAYLFALLFVPGIAPASLSSLHDIAILAVGAVLGSAAQINGYKQPIESIGQQVDQLRANQHAIAGAVSDALPSAAPAMAHIITPPGAPVL